MRHKIARLIAEAQIAWNEVFQGYPDHWSKVSGALSLAAELCPEGGIEYYQLQSVLSEEAEKFQRALAEQKMYRPPFESMATRAFNLAAGLEAIPEDQVNDTQLCYDCASKHLADAVASWDEWQGGDGDAWIEILGDLSHAANHLIERHPDTANAIRNDRKCVWEAIVKQSDPVRPDFEARIRDIFGLAGATNTTNIARQAIEQEAKELIEKARAKRNI